MENIVKEIKLDESAYKSLRESVISQLKEIRNLRKEENNFPFEEGEIDDVATMCIVSKILNVENLKGLDYYGSSVDNLRHWFTTICSDHQWDYSYLLDIIKLKASLMIEYFKDSPVSGSGEIIKEIKEVISSIDNIENITSFDGCSEDEMKDYFGTLDKAIIRFKESFNPILKWWD